MRNYVTSLILATGLLYSVDSYAQNRPQNEKNLPIITPNRVFIPSSPQPNYSVRIRQTPSGILTSTSDRLNGRTTTQNVSKTYQDSVRNAQSQYQRYMTELKAKGYIR